MSMSILRAPVRVGRVLSAPPAALASAPGCIACSVTFTEFEFKFDVSTCEEAPFLLVFSNAPRLGGDGLPFARVPYGSEAVTVQVPSHKGATKLFAQCVAWTISPVCKARVMEFCGAAEFPPENFGTAQSLDLMPKHVRQGRALVAWRAAPGAAPPRQEGADSARRAELIRADNTWWKKLGVSEGLSSFFMQRAQQRAALLPLDENLARMHIETLDWPESGVPLGFFMYHDAVQPDSETSVLAFLAAAGARSGRAPSETASLAKAALEDILGASTSQRAAPMPDTVAFAILVAEALQLMPNSFPYMPDTVDKNLRGKKHTEG